MHVPGGIYHWFWITPGSSIFHPAKGPEFTVKRKLFSLHPEEEQIPVIDPPCHQEEPDDDEGIVRPVP